MCGQELPELTEELFGLFEKNGSRLQYEAVYFARRKALAILGMVGLPGLEEEFRGEEYRKRLAEVIRSVCGEECWALPAHVNRKEDPQWRTTVDLFAAETAQTLAELADRLGAFLPGDLLELIRENVERRVLRPFFDSKPPYSGWERGDNNWNAVCCGAIGSACLHLLREEPGRLEACLERICEALVFYIDGFAGDGACMEGVGYYYYGMTYFVNFAQELYEYTEGKKDLFCGEGDLLRGEKELDCMGNDPDCMEKDLFCVKCNHFVADNIDKKRNIATFPAKCFFRDGCSVSFSDGDRSERFRMGVSCVLAMHYGDLEELSSLRAFFPPLGRAAGLHTDTCYRFAALKLDWIYAGKLLEALRGREARSGREAAEGRVNLLPCAQWAVAQSASFAGFACKGGHNGESHNHNDVGHFIYEAGGIFFLTDLGAGEYTREYFGKERYEILCNNSFGHSVPIVRRQGQGAGERYRCDSFCADGEGNVELELHSAYPEGLLEHFTRKFTFDLQTGSLAVTDCIRPGGSGAKVLENLITQIPPVLSDGDILLEKDGLKCRLSPSCGLFGVTVKELLHKNHQGQPEKVYAIQWPVPVSEDGFARGGFKAGIGAE